MRESGVWNYLDRKRPYWLAMERIEVKYPPGLSDCFWTDMRDRSASVSGWLELKHTARLGLGIIPKLKPEQPLFLRRQAANGVPCGILLKDEAANKLLLWRAFPRHEWVTRIKQPVLHNPPTWVWDLQWFNFGSLMDKLQLDPMAGPVCTVCDKQATEQDIDGGWWPPCEHAKKFGLQTLVYP